MMDPQSDGPIRHINLGRSLTECKNVTLMINLLNRNDEKNLFDKFINEQLI